jgi:hypothetical protein
MLWWIWYHFGIVSFTQLEGLIWNRDEQYTDTAKIEQLYPLINNNKRIFTIDIYRPIDFWLDSFFQYTTPGLPFVKWLFWESYRGNQIQSSYIASLLAPQNIVLDFHDTNTQDPQEYKRLRDGFITQHNIWWLLIWPPNQISYLTPKRHEMVWDVITNWTSYYTFHFTDEIIIHGVRFELYEVTPLDITIKPLVYKFDNTITITPINLQAQHFSEEILTIIKKAHPTTNNSGTLTKHIFFDKKNMPDRAIPIWSADPVYTWGWTLYTIDLGNQPNSVVISLPNMPWREITGTSWQSIHVAHGIYEKIISGTGRVTIRYQKTDLMTRSYLIAAICLLWFTYLTIRPKSS